MDNALIDQPTSSPTQHEEPGATPRVRGGARSNRRWIVTVCVLLGLSGAVRYGRDLQFLSLENQSKESPFPLKDIPNVLGTWRAVEGAEATLDPEIAKIAGSSDHIIRTYIDDKSQERVTVLLLYGPASSVWAHTPEVCYPATGFQPVVPSREVQIPLEPSGRTAAFRQALYGKSRGGSNMLHEVYYSFLNAGVWRSEMESQWKQFRYHPGMFKIQVERYVKAARLSDGPTQDLLASLVEEIETRSSSTPPAPAAAVAPAATGR
jgi:hypothetical protein